MKNQYLSRGSGGQQQRQQQQQRGEDGVNNSSNNNKNKNKNKNKAKSLNQRGTGPRPCRTNTSEGVRGAQARDVLTLQRILSRNLLLVAIWARKGGSNISPIFGPPESIPQQPKKTTSTCKTFPHQQQQQQQQQQRQQEQEQEQSQVTESKRHRTKTMKNQYLSRGLGGPGQ